MTEPAWIMVMGVSGAGKTTVGRRLAVLPYHLEYLRGTHEQIAPRLAARQGHFTSSALLSSHFLTLEEPENTLTVDIDLPVDDIVEVVIASQSANLFSRFD